MKRVFADTGYWIALLSPRDQLHRRAVLLTGELKQAELHTSEMVLVELLNSLSEGGSALRRLAVGTVEALRRNAGAIIHSQTSEQFASGLRTYAQAADKGWSLTDCVSFRIMEEEGIRSALTHDHHFVQAGYEALLR